MWFIDYALLLVPCVSVRWRYNCSEDHDVAACVVICHGWRRCCRWGRLSLIFVEMKQVVWALVENGEAGVTRYGAAYCRASRNRNTGSSQSQAPKSKTVTMFRQRKRNWHCFNAPIGGDRAAVSFPYLPLVFDSAGCHVAVDSHWHWHDCRTSQYSKHGPKIWRQITINSIVIANCRSGIPDK